jgi:hypothetical protein
MNSMEFVFMEGRLITRSTQLIMDKDITGFDV